MHCHILKLLRTPQVRKYVYHDADNLDTAFDAGGKVSIGLTATTIVSQWTWSATLLQSSTVASKVSQGRNTPNTSQIEKGTIFTVCTNPSCEAP